MLTLFLRTILLFLFTVLIIRLMGKRQIGQLQPFELVIAILIADLVAVPMGDVGTPLLYGIMPIVTLLFLHALLTICCLKSEKLRRLIDGKPCVLIHKGILQNDQLDRMGYSIADLLEELRSGGILNIREAGSAVLETSGKLSVFPDAQERPVTPKDLQLPVGYEGIPLTLIVDGRVQSENLTLAGLNENWLKSQIAPLGYDRPSAIMLCSLDTGGVLLVYGRGKSARMQTVQALQPEQVRW